MNIFSFTVIHGALMANYVYKKFISDGLSMLIVIAFPLMAFVKASAYANIMRRCLGV